MRRRSFLLALVATACSRAQESNGTARSKGTVSTSSDVTPTPRSSFPWSPDRVLPAEDLAKRIAAGEKPTLVHVGPESLFRSARVPGAITAGEAGETEGLAALARVAAPLPRDHEIIVYCGCCPYKNCPNIRPAYRKLVDEMQFTDVRVLDLPITFRAGWIDKGFPVERG